MGPNRATTLGNMILMENPVENDPIHVQLVSFNAEFYQMLEISN